MVDLTYYDPQQKAEVKRSLQIMYNRDADGNPVSTVAYLMDENGGAVASGMAIKHTADQFNRAVGRRLAFERAVKMYTKSYEDSTGKVNFYGRDIRQQLWKQFIRQVKVR